MVPILPPLDVYKELYYPFTYSKETSVAEIIETLVNTVKYRYMVMYILEKHKFMLKHRYLSAPRIYHDQVLVPRMR